MRSNIFKLIALTLMIFYSYSIQCQTVQERLAQLYEKYDSIHFLSFDAEFVYTSDTIFGKFENETVYASYTMNGKNSLYNIGNINFMQNDSFFVAVYHDQKIILVADPPVKNSGSNLPLRSLMDSMVSVYNSSYTVSQWNETDTGIIQFLSSDTNVALKKFVIRYNSNEKVFHSIRYEFEELAEIDSANYKIRQKSLTVNFKNYRFDKFDNSLYQENNYIYFDDKICKPITKYKEYKVYNSHSGFNRVIDIEQPAP